LATRPPTLEIDSGAGQRAATWYASTELREGRAAVGDEMAYTRGRCTNFDYCAVADSRRDVDVLIGESFVCPECGKILSAPPVEGDGTGLKVAMMIALGALVMLGGGTYLGMRIEQTLMGPKVVPVAAAPVASKPVAIATLAVPPPPSETVLMRIAGSPEMADLTTALASAYLAQTDTGVKASGDATSGTLKISGVRRDHREAIEITGTNAADAFVALAGGGTDLVMSVRPALQGEMSALGLPGTATASAGHVVALDALAVVVNAANPITSTTLDKLQSAFRSKAADWSNLGAPGGAIQIYMVRPPSELRDDFATTMLNSDAFATDAIGEPDMEAVAQAVAANRRGMGVVDLPHVGQLHTIAIEDGVYGRQAATPMDAAFGRYPLTYPMYLYDAALTSEGVVQDFIKFATSAEGQKIVPLSGFISPLMLPTAPMDANASDRLKLFTQGASRLDLVFHFQPLSNDPDPEGQHEARRLAQVLIAAKVSGERLLLAGFSDKASGLQAAQVTSKRRADAVASLLQENGLTPGRVAGFGADTPVGDNNFEAGRAVNRRVEVYLLP
jgi:phosphate transport system substrate-binding protein